MLKNMQPDIITKIAGPYHRYQSITAGLEARKPSQTLYAIGYE